LVGEVTRLHQNGEAPLEQDRLLGFVVPALLGGGHEPTVRRADDPYTQVSDRSAWTFELTCERRRQSPICRDERVREATGYRRLLAHRRAERVCGESGCASLRRWAGTQPLAVTRIVPPSAALRAGHSTGLHRPFVVPRSGDITRSS